MKNTDILSRINALLSVKVKLEQQTLENGTVVEADSFESGKPVFAIDGENKEPLEIGEYIMADGSTLIVTEIGVIGEILIAKIEEVNEEVTAKKDNDYEMAEVPPTLEEIIQAVVDAVQPKLDELQSQIDLISTTHAEMKKTLSSVSANKPLTHKPSENKVKMSEIKVAVNTSPTEARIFAMLSGN